jgi:hypothetical protein
MGLKAQSFPAIMFCPFAFMSLMILSTKSSQSEERPPTHLHSVLHSGDEACGLHFVSSSLLCKFKIVTVIEMVFYHPTSFQCFYHSSTPMKPLL